MLNNIKDVFLRLFDKKQHIIVGVSGGVDSSVLLDMLLKEGYLVVIAHVNHHKREASASEEKYISEYALANNIPCYIGNYHHRKGNFQAEARAYRLAFFAKIAQKYQTRQVALAHHAIDNLETILFRMLRGGDLLFYSGMLQHTTIGSIDLIRPFLDVSKDDLIAYANNHNITYFEDESNASSSYTRNRIRANVIPALLKEGDISFITRFSSVLKDANNTISKIVDLLYKGIFNTADFLAYDDYIKRALLAKSFAEKGLIYQQKRYDEILKVLNSPKPNITMHLEGDYVLLKTYDTFQITKQPQQPSFPPVKLGLSDAITIPNIGLFYFTKELPNIYSSFLKICYNIENFPLVIRQRVAGDRIEVNNATQKLKSFFINKKIPAHKRDTFIVEAKGKIVWVYDVYKQHTSDKNFIYLVYQKEGGTING